MSSAGRSRWANMGADSIAKAAVRTARGETKIRRARKAFPSRQKLRLSLCIAFILPLLPLIGQSSYLRAHKNHFQDCTVTSAGDGVPAEISPIVMAAARSM